MITDLRHAFRSLTRDRSFAVITILTLALGISANVTIFSAIDAVLLRPLPYPDQHRLVSLRQQDTRDPAKLDGLSPANFLDWRERTSSVLDLAAAEPFSRTLMLPDGPQRVRTWRVSDRFFDIVGVSPALGRTFVPTDFIAGRDAVLVLGYGTWMRQFGGDAGVVGRVLRVDNRPFTIVGVMPAAFVFPPGRDVWTPGVFTAEDRLERTSTYLRVVGRLRDGVSLDAARGRLDVVSGQLRAEYPREDGNVTAAMAPLEEALVGSAPRVLALFLAAVALLLITTCANVGTLSLVRVHRRRQELAVRTALGASAGRIRRLVLTESFLTAALGATAAIVISHWTVAFVRTMAPSTLPRAEQMTVSMQSVVAACVLAAAMALAIGLLSLASFSRTPTAMPTTSARGASLRRGWLQRSFVAIQLAVATMLVVAAGLLGRSLVTLIGEERGFRTDHLVTVTVFAWQDFPKPEQRAHFVEQAVDRLESIPGVETAAVGSTLPLAERIGPEIGRFTVPEVPVPAQQAPSAQTTIISPGYFESLGIPVRQGRTFTRFDSASTRPVVMINERLARQYWGDRSPIGRSIVVQFAGPPVARDIIGVVADAKRDLARDAPAALYIPHAQSPTGDLIFVVHTSREPATVVPAIRAAIQSVAPATGLGSIATLDTLLDSTLSPPRFTLMMVGFFAVAALLVGAIGTYGVIAYATAERTKEIGIRIALGSGRRQVIVTVMADGLRIAAAGVIVGLVLAASLSRMMADLLYGITPLDWPAYAVAAAALSAIALIACGVPAWRAARLDPLTVLRAD